MEEIAHIKEVARQAAIKAGKILRSGLKKELTISYKGESDLVTQIDTLSEQTIVSCIKKQFPDHLILAEEGTNQGGNSPWRWIIDPLDGTTNYTHRFPYFAVSIGVEYRSSMAVGLVYNPIHKELFMAERGKGATLNDQPLRVSSPSCLKEALLVTGFAYNHRTDPNNNINYFSDFLMKAQGLRRMGSAALDLCYVAAGRFDGFWELNLHPWDTAAGSLILTEAGGLVTDFSAKPFDINKKEILATNGKIHAEMVAVFNKAQSAA